MIKRTFIVERGVPDIHGDRILIEGIKLPPKGAIVITQDFQAHKSPVGIGKVYIEDGVLKCDAEINEHFVQRFPSIGIRPIEAVDNDHGGVDVKSSELVSLAVSLHPNMDKDIKMICDQKQVYKCSLLAESCMVNCPSPEDKTLCKHVKIKCNG